MACDYRRPSSGKTTLINALAKQGFQTASEVARDYMEHLLANNFSLDDIHRNHLKLQRAILAIALKRERHFQTNQLLFLDRGTPDSLGYFHFYQLDATHVIQACQHTQYKKIFYCHKLPVVHDTIRVENNASAQKIGELIYQAYLNLGYALIELPAVSVKQRMRIILENAVES